MPVYEYQCGQCGAEFEELAPSMNRPKSVKCPQCGKAGATRKFSTFASPHADSRDVSLPPGGCGRCGDPNGPCEWD
ncbi:MAG: zinc ribbon domain-containing protein [Phycisphaerales bacterium]|nr:MAG: zinc ribbon domain-containing protein [Phycisphaerales bacterium]